MHIPNRVSHLGMLPSMLVWILLSYAATASGQVHDSSLTVVYTGRLFGYYRIEADAKVEKELPPVHNFLKEVNKRSPSDGPKLLLGMGDNFGPEFGAAVQLENRGVTVTRGGSEVDCSLDPNVVPLAVSAKPGIEYPRSLYKDYNRYPKAAECDNVVNFMIKAGYRAIVPGREDLLYGPWWLNRTADTLQQRNEDPSLDRLQTLTILAANLRVKVAIERQPQELEQWEKQEAPKGICPLLLARDVLENREACVDDDTPAAVDWLKRIDRLISPSNGKATKAWSALQVRTIENGCNDTLQLRETLLANQTKAMQSMLPAAGAKRSEGNGQSKHDEWKDVQEQLTNLAKLDDSLATLAAAGAYVEQQSEKQAEGICSFSKALKRVCGENRSDQYSSACKYGEALVEKYKAEVDFRKRFHAGPNCSAKTAGQSRKEERSSPLLDEEKLGEGRKALLRAIYDSQIGVGFTEVELEWATREGHSDKSSQKTVLVIGVIGQEKLKPVSATNASICYKPGVPTKDAVVNCVNPKPDTQLPIYRAKLAVQNPVPIIEAILRATELLRRGNHKNPYDYKVLMAEMPKGEAQELEARLRADRTRDGSDIPQIDLIVSEAQTDHASPNLTLQYTTGGENARWAATPVFSPRPAYVGGLEQPLERPDSSVLISKHETATDVTYTVVNSFTTECDAKWSRLILANGPCPNATTGRQGQEHSSIGLHPADPTGQKRNLGDSSSAETSGSESALAQLLVAMQNENVALPLDCSTEKLNSKAPQGAESMACKVGMMQFLLQQLQRKSHADVVLLERRDFFLETLPNGYTDYSIYCKDAPPDKANECKLRVALDRVLWKGDYFDQVMMNGKDLATVMQTAASLSDQELALIPRDTSQEWLVTYGIVTPRSSVLTRMDVLSDEFAVPQENQCKDAEEEEKPSAGGKTMYCVNDRPLQADHAYWVATSDHLAEDKTVYATMAGQPPDYVKQSREYLTETIASILEQPLKRAEAEPRHASAGFGEQPRNEKPGDKILASEQNHQKRRIFDLNFAKVVAGYSFRQPQGGDSYVSSNFQGATDSRASATYSSELDVEGQTRMLWKGSRYSPGIQSNLEYDRSAQGNLSGNPVNGNYNLNAFKIGGFLQWNLHFPSLSAKKRSTIGPDLSAVRTMLVMAPYQFQSQLTGNYSFFPYSSPLNGQLTLHAPPVYGFAQKAGVRWEVSKGQPLFPFGKGTYVEIGGQWLNQRNVLSSVTLSTPGFAPFTCQADSDVTLANCFKTEKYPINSQTQVSSAQETLSNGGLYWDAHLQKNLMLLLDKSPGISLVIDSQGQAFLRRGAANALSTQTLYAVPVSVALAFPVFRNLSLAPQYSVFFYGNQVVGQNLVVNTFVMTARWYYDRDSGVPLIRQLFFKGPASADQTKTARIK